MTGGILRPGTTMPLVAQGLFPPCPATSSFRLNQTYLEDAAFGSIGGMKILGHPYLWDQKQNPSRPVIGILADRNVELAIAAYGAKKYPDAHWLLVPHVPGNTFIQGGRVFVHGATGFFENPVDGRFAGVMLFDNPWRIDRLFSTVPFDAEIGDRLVSLGHAVANPTFLNEITNDKVESHRIFEKAGIQSPRFVVLNRSEDHALESIKAAIRGFISEQGIPDFVVKTTAGSLGNGVRMFAGDGIDVAAAYAHGLFQQWDELLIEERIRSYPLMIDGRRMDWNIRVVIPPGDLTGWNILDTTEVRFNEFNGHPVNKSRGAQIAELETTIDRIGLSAGSRDKIVEGLRALSGRILEALRERLTEEAGAKAALYEQFLGLDVIVDEGLNLFMIEINSGSVGGIGSLIDIREGEAKFRAVDIIARNLLESARRMNAALPLPDDGNADREYLEGYYSWLNLCTALVRRREYRTALEVSDMVIRLNPDRAEGWYARGALLAGLGKSWDALEQLNRAIEICPEFAAARNVKRDVLADLAKKIDELPPEIIRKAIELKSGPGQSGQ